MTTDTATPLPTRHTTQDDTAVDTDAGADGPGLTCDAPLDPPGRPGTPRFGWEEREPFDENC
jgi:hypothetical protein